MTGDRLRLAVALLALLAFACTSRMDVQVIHYPEAADVLAGGPHCAPQHLGAADPALERCREIGDTFVGDTGRSWRCGRTRVLADVDAVACRVGANAVVVRRIDDPISGCYQARARLLVCPEPAAVAEP